MLERLGQLLLAEGKLADGPNLGILVESDQYVESLFLSSFPFIIVPFLFAIPMASFSLTRRRGSK